MAPVNENDAQENRWIKFPTLDWVRTPLGILLIAEMVLSFLCGCCTSSTTYYIGWGCGGSLGFMGTVTWTAFINLLIDFGIRIVGLWEHLLWFFRHPLYHLVMCGLAIVCYLIGSCLVAACGDEEKVYNPGAAIAGAFFGFICLALFSAEAFLHFKRYRNMQAEGRRQTEEEVKADVI